MKRNENGIEPTTRANKVRRLQKHIKDARHGERRGNPNDKEAIKALSALNKS